MKIQKKRRKGSNTEKNEKKNREILVVIYFFVVAFLFLVGNLVVFMVKDSEEVVNSSFNPRQRILASRNTRGNILSADGKVLAKTVKDGKKKEIRVYPYNEVFSHAVGYSTNGKMGVEMLANFQLLSSAVSIGEKVQNDISDSKNPGNNAITTFQSKLQEVAYKELGVYKGSILVTEPKTGKILAMVSKPDFDPNEIDDIWQKLVDDEKSSVLLNRATQGLYPPGSTFKIITALEYIRENPTNYRQYQYQCNGRFRLEDEVINCYHGTNHGQENFEKSFAKSCNASFANIASTLEKEKFGDTLNRLFFNQELPIKFNYKSSTAQINEQTTTAELLQTAIGQGKTQITPLHLAMITAAVANDGVMMKPYMVDHMESSSGTLLKTYQPKECGTVMSKEEADILKELMTSVVEKGTGSKLAGLSYTAAGKTGSAEYNGVKSDSHAWFTGFAPAETPEIVVTIIIEGAGSGGDYAVPIAKRIMDAYFENHI